MIYGLQKTSFIDCPGVDFGAVRIPPSICSVLFVGGCNLRCPYCHNKDIVLKTSNKLNTLHVTEFLEKRKHLINWVCISGGEPTNDEGIFEFLQTLKDLGFNIKLDTNGINVNILDQIKNLIHYFAIDVKALDYKVLGRTDGFDKLLKSIEILLKAQKPFLLRTTVYQQLVDKHFIETFIKSLNSMKKDDSITIPWYFNPFNNRYTLNEEAKQYQNTNKNYILNLLKDVKIPEYIKIFY